MSQFYAAVSRIPTSVWSALYEKFGSSAAHAAIRARIFNKFKAWIRKRQLSSPVFSCASSNTTQRALIDLIRAVMVDRKNIAEKISSDEQHKTLRAGAFASTVDYKALQYLKLRELPRAGTELAPDTLLRREQSKVYKRWLSGVEGMFKRTQDGYTPTNRSRYTDNVATTFGRRRVRFPASGRRRRSYDSLLHAFAKKISPSRFRRTSKLRFR